MNHMVTLKNGVQVPAIGLGTWYLGDSPDTRSREIKSLRSGIEAGAAFVDTAEMYGSGRSESLVGEAISFYDRDKLFLVSKVLPGNANRRSMQKSCENSLRRLKTDYLDLYLYHWRGGTPLRETVECLQALKDKGLIKAWGVSNFDIDDMEELARIDRKGECLVNQVLYHTGSRGIEFSLLPWMRKNGVALMSYCPLAQAGSLRRGLFSNPALLQVAKKHGATVPQIMLAWNIRDGHTIAIPRSGRSEHTLDNIASDAILLDEEDLKLIDGAYPKPTRKEWLDMQ